MSLISTAALLVTGSATGVAAVLLLLAPAEIVSLVAGWATRNGRLPASLPYFCDVSDPQPQGDAVHRTGRKLEPVEPKRYLVYLDGVGKSAPRDTRVARDLVRQLPEVLPRTRFVGHVTPYSPLNRALAAHPRLGGWWRLALRRFRCLVWIHNLAQTLVACDRRYHRAYREAVAQTVIEHLRASGYREGSGVPVVLLGYSGGAEVAVGITSRIATALRTPPVVVVSVGGVLVARGPLQGVGHLYHFRSHHDWLERLGALLVPGRWPIALRSGWNVARRAGRVSVYWLDGARHCGRRGYFSPAAVLPGGRSQLARTLRAICSVLDR